QQQHGQPDRSRTQGPAPGGLPGQDPHHRHPSYRHAQPHRPPHHRRRRPDRRRWSQGIRDRRPARRAHHPRHEGGMSRKPILSATDGGFSADDYWTAGQHRASGTRMLLWISLLAIGALLIWASLAEIDEMVKGEGKVVPSQQVQVIQSLDGGIVKEILVRPGQHVEPGQVLLRIDPTRYSSSLGENRAESLALAAKAARLEALATGQPFVAPDLVASEAPEVIELETRIWQTKQREIDRKSVV